MKKVSLFIAMMYMIATAQAQYFHSLYDEYSGLGNGMTTNYLGDGHVMAGATINTPPALAPPQSLIVVHTDIDGDFTRTVDFNNIYELYDALSGARLEVSRTKVVELKNGSGYAVMGDYRLPLAGTYHYGLFYLQLDSKGSPLAVYGYQDTRPTLAFKLTSIVESVSTPGDIFATGTDDINPFVMRIDPSGALVWSYIYDFGPLQVQPNDILESPFAAELMVVGSCNAAVSTIRDGLWMAIDPRTGSMFASEQYDAGADDLFNAIAVSNDPFSPGFILAGTTNASPARAYRMWGLKANPGRGVLWTNYYAESSVMGNDQEGIDVVGRLNTSGKYEYYMTGPSYTGTAFSYAEAFKIDDIGNVVPSGGFQFAIPGTYDWPLSVDVNTRGTADGLSIYATSNLRNGCMHLTKAYFNGVTACYEKQPDAFTNRTGLKIIRARGVIINKLINAPLKYSRPIPYTYINLCYAPSLPNGDNARPAPTGIGQLSGAPSIKVYPNPATDELHITGLGKNMPYHLLSVTGTSVQEGVLQSGSNKISLKGLSSGMYLLEVASPDGRQDRIKIIKE